MARKKQKRYELDDREHLPYWAWNAMSLSWSFEQLQCLYCLLDDKDRIVFVSRYHIEILTVSTTDFSGIGVDGKTYVSTIEYRRCWRWNRYEPPSSTIAARSESNQQWCPGHGSNPSIGCELCIAPSHDQMCEHCYGENGNHWERCPVVIKSAKRESQRPPERPIDQLLEQPFSKQPKQKYSDTVKQKQTKLF